jgi:hypothetical protein
MRHALTGLALIVLALLSDPRAGAREPGFSRAEWIEAHEVENHFDGGALPGHGDTLPYAVRAFAASGVSGKATVVNTLVNVDLIEDDGGFAQPETQAEPFLAIDPQDERRLLAAYQDARFESGGARALTYSLSTNAGRRWSTALIPGLTILTGGPWQRASDPWVAFGPGHRAYYASLAFDESRPDNSIVVSTSTDGGSTFGDPVTVHRPRGTDFDDKEAVVIDTYPTSPFLGRVYVTWDMVRDGDGQPLLFSWSADGGESFSPPVTIREGVNLGVVPVVAPGGVVHLVWGNFAPFDRVELLTARSDDGGATWSAPLHVEDAFAAGVQGMRVGDGLASAAVDRRNGTLYVVWEDARNTGRVDQIMISRSTDGGESWSPAEVISDGPDNAASFTPAVAVDGKGRVGVTYYSLRNDPDRTFGVDLYVTVSSNGGRTFGASRRISQATWDATFAAFSRGKFLGDYQGLVAGQRLFHPLFVSTYRASSRDGSRRQPDVFTASIR